MICLSFYRTPGSASAKLTILHHISLSLEPGAPTVLIGPNGSGKTTLIRIAMGLCCPTTGSITWGGRAHSHGDRRAMVFQRPVMLRRTAANVAFALAAAGISRNEQSALTAERPARLVLKSCLSPSPPPLAVNNNV